MDVAEGLSPSSGGVSVDLRTCMRWPEAVRKMWSRKGGLEMASRPPLPIEVHILAPDRGQILDLWIDSKTNLGVPFLTDEPDNLVLAQLRKLDVKVDRIAGDVAELRKQAGGHTRTLNVLQQDVRLIRAAVNDIARVDVTSGEVEALHHDLNRLQQEVSELAARVEVIERRDTPGR